MPDAPADMMDIKVRLLMHLARYSPSGESRFMLRVRLGATVCEVLAELGIPEKTPKVVAVNAMVSKLDRPLARQDQLTVMPPITGG